MCNHSRQNPLPPTSKCQTWLHSHMDTSRSSAGEGGGGAGCRMRRRRGGGGWWCTVAKTVCAKAGLVYQVCTSTNISRPRCVRRSTRGSASSICRTDQVVTGHLLFITGSLFTEDLATNSLAQKRKKKSDTWWEVRNSSAGAILLPLALH